jgi:hypothetical protein
MSRGGNVMAVGDHFRALITADPFRPFTLRLGDGRGRQSFHNPLSCFGSTSVYLTVC